MTRAIVLSHLGHELLVAPEPSLRPTRCAVRGTLPPLVAGDELEVTEQDGQYLALERRPRRTLLERQTPRGLRPICANLDTLLITYASEPAPHGDLIDPLLAAAFDAGLSPWLIHNKADRPGTEAQGLSEAFQTLGFPVFHVSARTGEGVDALRKALIGRRAAFAGQSGVGKSSPAERPSTRGRREGGHAIRTAESRPRPGPAHHQRGAPLPPRRDTC